MAPTAMPTLKLNAKEERLRNLLVDAAAFIDSAGLLPEPLILRWAGGWVRDKLLGIESHDIDTAINVMTGYTFGEELGRYCDQEKHRKKHNMNSDDLGGIHKIAANPDKSKHLETATLRLFGLDVDFVNLRKETYTQDSRNPTMEFGTAEEDARRRDATINALFYNLHTGHVEDFTGGLVDMEARLIRTPMDPLQTFMDDPLRVLRLIRFASRLGFDIDPAATAVMAEPGVLDALRLKISRNNPRSALDLIHNLALYEAIFSDPNGEGHPPPDTSKWNVAYECLDRLARDKAPGSIYDTLVRSDEAAFFAWNLAAVTPYAYVKTEMPTPKSRQTMPMTTLAAQKGIKASNKLSEVLTAAYRNRAEIVALKQSVYAKEAWASERDKVGMAIRRWDATKGGHWRLQILYALLVDAMENTQPGSDAESNNCLASWRSFLNHLEELGVMEAPTLKTLVDGDMLKKALGVKSGRWMGPALNICVAWQLRHPGEINPAGAIEEVRKRARELGIDGLQT
ncbi:CCA tRNA nucleotidyltransferase, mitochondrial [Colletotrichum chlorophyti]|uniref:CCA tRNA nucleotidyltransferase, mitochondrial n=1 Tax=Colletotrichum chlorophyti TaxID=708187 RepID=A0A1Q8S7H3_9PEZI|nr:CCA tRNA nucleotidyltransferase, mitochondrial [Colletotrichum chlorophyti]